MRRAPEAPARAGPTRAASVLRASVLRASVLRAALSMAALSTAGLALVGGSGRADLRGPRDVARACAALRDEDDDARREAAARWLALHGPDGVVVPALLEALGREQDLGVSVPMALALARRARPEDAEALLALEPRLRAPARAALVVALAQLGTEETDTWLVGRLATPPGSELRPAVEQAAEIARARRDALLPRVLDAIAEAPAGLLVEWLASLADERARGALLVLAVTPSPHQSRALEGLALLGPDAETARRLRAPVEGGLVAFVATGSTTPPPAQPRPVSVPLARALVAADPGGEHTDLLREETPDVRAATLQALAVRAPARLLALLGADPRALRAEDRHVLASAIASPSEPLVPWLEATLHDEDAEPALREEALEALVTLPACALALEDVALSPELLALAEARLERRCPDRAAHPLGEGLAGLHLRAIAGRDVRDEIALEATRQGDHDARLALAHAWLASVEADPRVVGALARETDAEVFAVLALAAAVHGVRTPDAVIRRGLAARETRLASLWLATLPEVPRDPHLLRAVSEALHDGDPAVRAMALHPLHALAPTHALAHACAALESPSRAARRSARAVLRPTATEAPSGCLARRARIDPDVRAALSAPAAEPATRGEPLVVRVTSNIGAPLLTVTLETEDGRTARLRPPAEGLVVVPTLGVADAILRLDAEPSQR